MKLTQKTIEAGDLVVVVEYSRPLPHDTKKQRTEKHKATTEAQKKLGTDELNIGILMSNLDAENQLIMKDAVEDYCKENNIYCCPGCVTPTEIMKAISLGLDVVKFFPANVYGGLKALKALAAPFTGVKFLPTGGINEENMSEYAEAPFIIAIGGSFVCTKKDIKDNNFDKITELSKITVEKIKKARS